MTRRTRKKNRKKTLIKADNSYNNSNDAGDLCYYEYIDRSYETRPPTTAVTSSPAITTTTANAFAPPNPHHPQSGALHNENEGL
ncbi:uncharacterized protein PG986_000095 [Apiospora aurea]|uniref:Uncharacterized protein n=1 Tax=Apiospora aurea TaxID=335848 RepID=A0ABR1QT18_9PEZI